MKIKKKLHLKELDHRKISILLKTKVKKELFKNTNKYMNNNKTSKFLKVSNGTIRYWKSKGQHNTKTKERFTKSFIPLRAIYKLIKFLRKKGHKKYSAKFIEKNIQEFKINGGKGIKKPKFPINFETKEGAIMAAAILCDGGINKAGYPLYNNSELCMRKKVVCAINKLIGKIDADPKKPNKNNCLIFSKVITEILVKGLKMKIGDKVNNNPKIPKLFLKTNKMEVIGAYLNQAFSDDGSVYFDEKRKQGAINYGESTNVTHLSKGLRKKIKRDNLYKYGANLVNGGKELLEKLGIKSNGPYCRPAYQRRKYGRNETIHSWIIQIQGKNNLQKFKKLVGFSILRKNKKLEKIIKSYTEIEYGASYKDAKRIVIELSNKNKKINVETFSKERKCNKEYAQYLLKILRKKKIIKRIGGGHIFGIKGCTPHEYELNL